MRRLLLNRNNAIAVQNCNAVACRIWHPFEHHAGPFSLREEIRNRRLNRRFKNVIAEENDNLAARSEPLRQRKRMRNPPRLLLHPIGKLTSELGTAAKHLHKIADIFRIRHDKNIRNACRRELLDAVKNHRLVAYRQQVLTRHFGERMQTGA